MASVKDSVKEQENAVVETELRFNGIAEAIETTMEIIERLNASGREMDNMKNQILSVLGNLAAIAEENAASTEEVSASTEELSASINMFSEASSSLASLAQNLQSEINKFKV